MTRRCHVVSASSAAINLAIRAGLLPGEAGVINEDLSPHFVDVCVWSQYRGVEASGALIFYDHEDRTNPLTFEDVVTFAVGEWRAFVEVERTPDGMPRLGTANVEDALRRAGKKRR